MMKLSHDPYIAESQMHAIIHHLVAVGYIDADFDPAERQFIRQHIARLVEDRAREIHCSVGQDILDGWTRHFHEVLDEIDQRIQRLFLEPVAQGETSAQYVLSRLKLGCFELLKRFDEEGQREILAVVAAGRSNLAIARHFGVTQRAVEKHVNEIFGRLGIANDESISRRVHATLLFLAEDDAP